MANKHRGEVDARLDGKTYTLCLTLGALAELESAFGDADMVALATRFETGRISARDAILILGAGLRASGHDVSDAQVAAMKAEGGAACLVAVVARLLSATFGGGEASQAAAAGSPRNPIPPPQGGREESRRHGASEQSGECLSAPDDTGALSRSSRAEARDPRPFPGPT